jgi:hypothetical protein
MHRLMMLRKAVAGRQEDEDRIARDHHLKTSEHKLDAGGQICCRGACIKRLSDRCGKRLFIRFGL